LLREGKVPEIIRRKGAEGSLSVPLEDKIEILVFLATAQDETIAKTAFSTLETWETEELLPVLANPATPLEVLDFAAHHMIFGRQEIADALLRNRTLPEDLRDWINQTTALEREASLVAPTPIEAVAEAEGEKEDKRLTLLQRINRMTAAEKIKTALTGNQEERLVLIRDSNKIVARAVLQSPKLSDLEVENFAAMKNVTEEVLRLIAMNRKFIKSYSVMRSLVNNPRTPIDVALPILNRLNERDLKSLTINKNVAEVLRSMATKMIKQKEEAQKPKIPGKKH